MNGAVRGRSLLLIVMMWRPGVGVVSGERARSGHDDDDDDDVVVLLLLLLLLFLLFLMLVMASQSVRGPCSSGR